MRVIERTAARAELPLRHSRGFNPRAMFSLICPRPVGVATRDDCLVLALESPIRADELLAGLNRHCPDGMRFFQAEPLGDIKTLHPRRVVYEMPLQAGQAGGLARRAEHLAGQSAWLVSRPVKARGNRGRGQGAGDESRDVDIRPMVADLAVTDRLRFACVPHNGAWARPGEVLQLLGMTGPEQLARLIRVRLETDQAEQRRQNTD